MTKFKNGDKVRIKKALGAINHETNKPFKKKDITTVTGIITDYHVRVGHGLNHQESGNVMYVENLELVEEDIDLDTEEEQLIDDKLTHLHSVVITVPKKDASGSYVNYKLLLDTLSSNNLIVNLSKCDRLVSINESVEYINIEVLNEDLVYLAKSFNFPINELRNLNQTTLDLKLNGQYFVLDTQEEMDYSTTLINGLIGNI